MNADNVLRIYGLLKDAGISTWIDGGWCIDALLGKQEKRPDSSEWMYKFKTAYESKEKDIQDVQARNNKFGYELPER